MLGWWLLYAGAALLLATVAVAASPRGKKWLRAQRGKVGRRAGRVTREAWRARRNATARGRLRAERRKQPHRLTFGHRRRDDDPPLARRAVDRARLGWANRRPLRAVPTGTHEVDEPQRRCGSTRTDTGHPCQNLRMVGRNYCWTHKPWWTA